MKINIRYTKEKDLFELQLIESKLRSHFIMSRNELNRLRSILEKALITSKSLKNKE